VGPHPGMLQTLRKLVKDASTVDRPSPAYEARRRLEKFGPNAVARHAMHPLRRRSRSSGRRFPWNAEAAIVLEIVPGQVY